MHFIHVIFTQQFITLMSLSPLLLLMSAASAPTLSPKPFFAL